MEDVAARQRELALEVERRARLQARGAAGVAGEAVADRLVEVLVEAVEVDAADDVTVDDSVAVIAAVGDRMRGTPGIAAKVFGALGEAGVNVIAISQGSSERNISLIVSESDAAEAVRVVHRAFDLATRPQGTAL